MFCFNLVSAKEMDLHSMMLPPLCYATNMFVVAFGEIKLHTEFHCKNLFFFFFFTHHAVNEVGSL